MTIDSAGLSQRLLAAQAIAREAGRLASRMLAERQALTIEFKGPQNFVTSADRAAEALIAERLGAAFPQDSILAEEGTDRRGTSGAVWAVDPIDGTSNFAAGRADWCVSLGLVIDGRAELGAIYLPATDLLYSAHRGRGATRNGVPIAVAQRPWTEATILLEYAASARADLHLAHILAVVSSGADYRRNGSAAVALTQVAEGTLDGFFEMHLNAWDVAAGLVLVAEAGGVCSDFLAIECLRRPQWSSTN